MLLAALDAKKDVYLEKPMSHSLEQSQQMIEAVRKTKQIVQIGMQRRSAPSVIKAKEIVDSGILGKITHGQAACGTGTSRKTLDNSPLPGKLDWKRFLGSAKDRDLQPMRFRYWRYFWDYSGGNMTDQGTHLMDVVQWFTNSGPAQSAVCYGQVAKNDRLGSAGRVLRGLRISEADGHLDAELLQLVRQRLVDSVPGRRGHDDHQQRRLPHLEGAVAEESASRCRSMEAPIPIETHIQNFLDCVKSRKEPNAPVEVGASAVSGAAPGERGVPPGPAGTLERRWVPRQLASPSQSFFVALIAKPVLPLRPRILCLHPQPRLRRLAA